MRQSRRVGFLDRETLYRALPSRSVVTPDGRCGCDLPRPATLSSAMTDAEKQVAELRKKRDDLKKALKAAERRRSGAIERRLRRAESRLRGQARRDDTRRLILRGRLSERKLEQASLTDPNARARNQDELDTFLTRDRDRALFDLPGLVGPSKPSEPPGERDSPLPGWNPKKLPDGSWGAAFSGDTAALPDELAGLPITVTPRNGKSWTATVIEVIERTDRRVHVRHKRD